MTLFREMTKSEMRRDRIRKHGWLQCDYCKSNRGQDMHEVITRARTINNLRIRELSYDKHLCCILCEHCHQYAPLTSKQGVETLFQALYSLYGESSVREAFERIPVAYTKGIDLP